MRNGGSLARLGLRYPQPLAQQLLRGVLSMKESTTYQLILQEGQVKGALAEAQKLLLLQGEKRFGPPDADTLAALCGINDVARLEELWVRLLDARSWQDLLPPAKPRRRTGRRRGG